MMGNICEVTDWAEWGESPFLDTWQWVALSVRLPADQEGLETANACATDADYPGLSDTEQGKRYYKRLRALETAIKRGEVFGVQDDGRLSSSGFIVWCREKQEEWKRMPEAERQQNDDYSLPPELRHVMRPARKISTSELRDKWPSAEVHVRRAQELGLAYVAGLHDRGFPNGHGWWDEDAAVFWAKRRGSTTDTAEGATDKGGDVIANLHPLEKQQFSGLKQYAKNPKGKSRKK